jgi:hypothetical protein
MVGLGDRARSRGVELWRFHGDGEGRCQLIPGCEELEQRSASATRDRVHAHGTQADAQPVLFRKEDHRHVAPCHGHSVVHWFLL